MNGVFQSALSRFNVYPTRFQSEITTVVVIGVAPGVAPIKPVSQALRLSTGLEASAINDWSIDATVAPVAQFQVFGFEPFRPSIEVEGDLMDLKGLQRTNQVRTIARRSILPDLHVEF